jgi:hypothetical protein
MADFCRDCADEIWGDPELNDFEGICDKGYCATVLCEGCGDWILVDHTGKKIDIRQAVQSMISDGEEQARNFDGVDRTDEIFGKLLNKSIEKHGEMLKKLAKDGD